MFWHLPMVGYTIGSGFVLLGVIWLLFDYSATPEDPSVFGAYQDNGCAMRVLALGFERAIIGGLLGLMRYLYARRQT